MSPEDLDQIRGVVRGECATLIAAAEQRIVERQEQAIAGLEQRLLERQDRAVEALTANMSDLRTELHRRMETLEERFNIQAPVILSIDARMTAINRGMDNLLTGHHSQGDTLAAQQRAIDDLAARVARLERAQPNAQQ